MTVPSDRTVDQLDAWLETASRRDSRPSPPNGATDPTAYDLVTTAHAFHSRMNAAEQRTVPAIPAKAIWEDVMSSTTAGTISIPALAPSGAGSPPKAPTPPVADSSWPKPGHWAVPAFLVVALMIGILWFYSSFFGSTDPGPTPTSQPGFAFSTPTEENVDPALLDPVTRADCDVEPLSLQEIGAYQVDPGENVPRVYGPIAPVSHAEAIALYESGFTWEACEAFGDAGQKQAVLSPRHIFEGRHDSIARNSASVEDYIANNQALATALLDPNRTNYTAFSSQEIPVNAQATPAAIDSWFGYRLLPQDVVQFPDGRRGGPLTDILPANYDEYWEDFFAKANQPTPIPYDFTVVEYVIFAEHDGRWLLDERFTLCAVNCDQWLPYAELVYQGAQSLVHTPTPIVLSATPFASPVATQATPDSALQPITPSECSVEGLSQDEVSAIIRSTTEPLDRSWVPVGPVDPATAAQISRIDRAWQACDAFGSIGQRTVLQTDYLTSTGPEQSFDQASTEEALLLWLDRFDQRRDLGDSIFASIDTYLADAQLVFDTHGTGETLPFDQRISLPAPDTAILLADGRIALPIIDPYILSTWERAQSSESVGQFLYIPVHVLALDSDTNSWLVDEVISLCVGDCDTALALVQDVLDFYDIDSSPSTPQDSPVATPSSDENDRWLVNRDDIDRERNENSLPDTFVTPDGTIATGDYLPFAEADPEMQVAVARQFQLLAANCTSSPDGTPLISEDMSVFPAPSQRPVSQEQLDFTIALSDAVSTGDPLDFILEAEPGLVPTNGFQAETATLGIVFPESVVQLPDGRYGAPLHLAIESTDPAGTRWRTASSNSVKWSGSALATATTTGRRTTLWNPRSPPRRRRTLLHRFPRPLSHRRTPGPSASANRARDGQEARRGPAVKLASRCALA